MSGKGAKGGLQKARIGLETGRQTTKTTRIIEIPATTGSGRVSAGGISAAFQGHF